MDQTLIPVSDESGWTRALAGLRHAFGHRWVYGCAMERSSGLKTFLYVAREGSHAAVCPLSFREKESGYGELVSPYGFAGIVSNFSAEEAQALPAEWFRFCQKNGFVTAYVMQNPLFPLTNLAWRGRLTDHHTLYLVDLTPSAGELWKQMGETHRYEIRRLAGSGAAEVVTDNARLKNSFKRLYPETLERVHASKVYHFSDAALDQLMESSGALLVGVEDHAGIQAVSLFLHTPWVAEYFLSASSMDGRKYSRQVIWTAMTLLKETGVACLNMGGGVRPGDSIDQFKRRFGGRAVSGQVLKAIFDQEKYACLCRKHCAGNEAKISFFPPYWAAVSHGDSERQ